MVQDKRHTGIIDIDKVFAVHTLIRDAMFRYNFHAKVYKDAEYQSSMLRILSNLIRKSEVFYDGDNFPYIIQAGRRRYIL